MGVQANLEILNSRIKVQFPSIEQAIEDLQWRTDPFTTEEKTRLTEFLKTRFAERTNSSIFSHEGFSRWALIWWVKPTATL
jgi:hypothetical protein